MIALEPWPAAGECITAVTRMTIAAMSAYRTRNVSVIVPRMTCSSGSINVQSHQPGKHRLATLRRDDLGRQRQIDPPPDLYEGDGGCHERTPAVKGQVAACAGRAGQRCDGVPAFIAGTSLDVMPGYVLRPRAFRRFASASPS